LKQTDRIHERLLTEKWKIVWQTFRCLGNYRLRYFGVLSSEIVTENWSIVLIGNALAQGSKRRRKSWPETTPWLKR
jgi:hypothetical protein